MELDFDGAELVVEPEEPELVLELDESELPDDEPPESELVELGFLDDVSLGEVSLVEDDEAPDSLLLRESVR